MEKTKTVKSKRWHKANRELRIELDYAGMSGEEDRRALYECYTGKSTAAQMSSEEIELIVRDLRRVRCGESEKSRLRKRVIASVCKWLEGHDGAFAGMNAAERIDRAKKVAARAAKASFNEIDESKLRGLYYAFNKMNEMDREAVVAAEKIMMEGK